MTTNADGRGASDLCDQLGQMPKRPDCWEFAMEFLGAPENAEVQRYVDALEAWAVACAAAERERCAKVCEYVASSLESAEEDAQAMSIGAQSCADQIRALA